MPDMAVGHDQVVVTNSRLIARPSRTVDGDVLPNDIVVTDDKKAFLAFKLTVLRNAPEDRPGEDVAAAPQSNIGLDDGMGPQTRSIPDDGVFADDRKRSDLDIIADLRTWVNTGCRVYLHAKVLSFPSHIREKQV